MRVQRCGSEVGRGVTWVRAWPENVGVARVEATCSMGERVSYRMDWFSAWWSLSRNGFQIPIHTIDLTVPRWLKNPTEIAPASGARYKSLITGRSTLSVDPHLLRLSIDNPTLLHHRIMRDIEQLLQCLTGIHIRFVFYDLGLIYFCDRGRVGVLSFLGIERIRALVEETILDTMGNEVAICLRPYNRMVVLVEVGSELRTSGYEVRIRV